VVLKSKAVSDSLGKENYSAPVIQTAQLQLYYLAVVRWKEIRSG